MEREFLKSLAETRAIEAKLRAEIKAAESAESASIGTRKGALAVQEHIQKLANRGDNLRAQLASDRARFSALHHGWKVCRWHLVRLTVHDICCSDCARPCSDSGAYLPKCFTRCLQAVQGHRTSGPMSTSRP